MTTKRAQAAVTSFSRNIHLTQGGERHWCPYLRMREGGYSLWRPIQEGSARKGYLSQASGIWKGRGFSSWSIKKGREICHLGLWKGPIGLKNEFYGFIKSRLTLSTSSPGRFSLALEVGAGKAPWGRGCNAVFLWGNTCLWINSEGKILLLLHLLII